MNRVVRAALAAALTIGSAPVLAGEPAKAAVGFIEVDPAITLRHMVVHNPNPKGTVLLLHGFPETLYVWQDMSAALADDYEVHAFDWPGYGQSSRPAASEFAYAPRDYARVLKAYIAKAGIDRSKLTIYATDIGALPALLAALDDPDIARTIIVGDFAPFDRPQHMQEIARNGGGRADTVQSGARRDFREFDPARPCARSAVRGAASLSGRPAPRMGAGRHDLRRCLLSLLFALQPRSE